MIYLSQVYLGLQMSLTCRLRENSRTTMRENSQQRLRSSCKNGIKMRQEVFRIGYCKYGDTGSAYPPIVCCRITFGRDVIRYVSEGTAFLFTVFLVSRASRWRDFRVP